MHSFKDDRFRPQAEGYHVRLGDPKSRALLRVMVSMHALKGVFFVESFDSRTEQDKKDNATRRRSAKTEEVPTTWAFEDQALEIDPETRRLAGAYQRRLALERDLELGSEPVLMEKAIATRLDSLREQALVAVSAHP